MADLRRVDVDDLEYDLDQRVIGPDGLPFTGEAIERDANGNVLAIVTYRDGWKDGPEIHYYPNGQLKAERIYNDEGRLVDVHRYAPDGTRIE